MDLHVHPWFEPFLSSTICVIELGPVRCVEADSLDTSTAGNEDAGNPAIGQAFFYMAAYDAPPLSGYGSADSLKPQQPTSGDCP